MAITVAHHSTFRPISLHQPSAALARLPRLGPLQRQGRPLARVETQSHIRARTANVDDLRCDSKSSFSLKIARENYRGSRNC